MLFKKNFKHNGRWASVALGEEELKALSERLREDNLRVLRQCLQDAEGLANDGAKKTDIALALFSKLADAKYTRITATLDEMVETERMGGVY